jgi:hypothetical protein
VSFLLWLKKLLLLTRDLTLLGCGFYIAAALAAVLGIGFFGDSPPAFAVFVSVFGLLAAAAVGAQAAWRKKNVPAWEIENDAAEYLRAKCERTLYPHRARIKRRVARIVIWLPSILAAVAAIFLPATTHIRHPLGYQVGGYSIPIPWSLMTITLYDDIFTVCSTRRGITPLGHRNPVSSVMTFWAVRDAGGTPWRAEGRPMKLGAFECRDDSRPPRHFISCDGPRNRSESVHASFSGGDIDTGVFYAIVEGIKSLR